MKQTKNIPKGYKDSPIGVIPVNWQVKRLGEIYSQISSFSFSREYMSDDKDIGYIHYGDIHTMNRDNIDLNIDAIPSLKKGTIPQSKLENENFPYLRDGDLLLTDASEDYDGIGKPLEILSLNDRKIIAGLHTIALRSKIKELHIGYGRYLLKNKESIIKLKSIAQGTKVYSISYNSIKEIYIPLPPLFEQKKIAEILSTWDKAIDKQSQIVAQLELREKALMQQLLSGKKRLKGFTGEWKEYKIRNFAKEYSLRNKNNKDLTVLSCTKYDGLVPSLEYFGRQVFSDDISTYKLVPKGYFAYATNHIEEGSIGYQDFINEGVISPMYTVFKTDENINDYFLYPILKSHKLIYEYNARMEGSIDRRGGLRWEAFSSIKVRIPSYEE